MPDYITYTCYGSVRGCCGHEHRTEDAAFRCIERDTRGCASHGGYSDRQIFSRTPEDREHEPNGPWRYSDRTPWRGGYPVELDYEEYGDEEAE